MHRTSPRLPTVDGTSGSQGFARAACGQPAVVRLVDPVVPEGRLSSRPQPVLDAGHLFLRPWSSGDADVLLEAFTDPLIRRWHVRTFESSADASACIDGWNRSWRDESGARWAVVDVHRERVVGQVGLCSIDLAEGEGAVSYWVMPEARRTGVAVSAAQRLTRWAFDDLGLHRLELHHSVGNAASCRVAERAGFPADHANPGRGADAAHADQPERPRGDRPGRRALPRPARRSGLTCAHPAVLGAWTPWTS